MPGWVVITFKNFVFLPGPSSPRMIFFVDPLQTLPRYKSIDLSGRNITMTQHLLNEAKVSISRQKMGGEGVP